MQKAVQLYRQDVLKKLQRLLIKIQENKLVNNSVNNNNEENKICNNNLDNNKKCEENNSLVNILLQNPKNIKQKDVQKVLSK